MSNTCVKFLLIRFLHLKPCRFEKDIFRKNSTAMSNFLNDVLEKNPEKYPDGCPCWGEVVDKVVEEGMPQVVKMKFWLWVNAQFGTHARDHHVICDKLVFADGYNVQKIMTECWPKLRKITNDPDINVCDIA